MKAIIAILFTVLYTAFFCFAVTGTFTSTCKIAYCTNEGLAYKGSIEINIDYDHGKCTHKPVVTIHVAQKQTNNIAADGSKYLLFKRQTLQEDSAGNLQYMGLNKLYSQAATQNTCPLFIKYCALLI